MSTSRFCSCLPSAKRFLPFFVLFVLHAQGPGGTGLWARETEAFPNIPNHIGVIMDGNGRWGEQKHGHRTAGHQNAHTAVQQIVEACVQQGVRYLTLYAFSTENWRRPKAEVSTIFAEIAKGIQTQMALFQKHGIKLAAIGDTTQIPADCWKPLQEAIQSTRHHKKLTVTLALNYGGKAEMVAASQAIARDSLHQAVRAFLQQGFQPDASVAQFMQFLQTYQPNITSASYEQHLPSRDLPALDLIIRTGRKHRLSNFLPWQGAYAEIYFSDLLWPDFRKKDLLAALRFYEKQHRTFGAVL